MSDIKFNRRNALKGLMALGVGSAGAGGLSSLALATPEALDRTQRFVFCYFPGAWDILLSLDPRRMADYPVDDMALHRIQPAYDMVEMADASVFDAGGLQLGPYLGDSGLASHAEKLCIVRGMSMETLAHDVGRRRFITGKPPAGLLARGSSVATWLAANLGIDDPIPNLAVQVESYNRDLPPAASGFRVSTAEDLVRGLSPADPAMDPALDSLLNHFHAGASSCARARRSPVWRSGEGGRVKAREMLQLDLDSLFDLNRVDPVLDALKAEFGVFGNVRSATPEVQSLLAYQAITGGVSRCASIVVTAGLDTHFSDWADDQGRRQRQGFDAVARLVSQLQATRFEDTSMNWLDVTTIVCFSEFSRTPLLNAQEGRDHSLTNATMMIGGRTKPGTYGASSNVGMEPQSVNLNTGELDRGGEIARPEHLMRELMIQAGIEEDIADLRVPGYPAAFRST